MCTTSWLSRLSLGCLSAASRLPLGCPSAASRLPLVCISRRKKSVAAGLRRPHRSAERCASGMRRYASSASRRRRAASSRLASSRCILPTKRRRQTRPLIGHGQTDASAGRCEAVLGGGARRCAGAEGGGGGASWRGGVVSRQGGRCSYCTWRPPARRCRPLQAHGASELALRRPPLPPPPPSPPPPPLTTHPPSSPPQPSPTCPSPLPPPPPPQAPLPAALPPVRSRCPSRRRLSPLRREAPHAPRDPPRRVEGPLVWLAAAAERPPRRGRGARQAAAKRTRPGWRGPGQQRGAGRVFGEPRAGQLRAAARTPSTRCRSRRAYAQWSTRSGKRSQRAGGSVLTGNARGVLIDERDARGAGCDTGRARSMLDEPGDDAQTRREAQHRRLRGLLSTAAPEFLFTFRSGAHRMDVTPGRGRERARWRRSGAARRAARQRARLPSGAPSPLRFPGPKKVGNRAFFLKPRASGPVVGRRVHSRRPRRRVRAVHAGAIAHPLLTTSMNEYTNPIPDNWDRVMTHERA